MKVILIPCIIMMSCLSHLWAQAGIIPGDSVLNISVVGPRTDSVNEDLYEKIYYVSGENGSDETGDGSEDDPWKTIIAALLHTKNESESHRYAIFVAAGTYNNGTIYMQEWVDLFGGFNSDSWDRDIIAYKTILDGEGLRRIVIGQNNSKIDGFVIANGLSRSHGAGILCDDSSPTISNNIITNNLVLEPANFNRQRIHQEGYHGGGIACLFNAVPTIKNNLLYNNRTSVGTGAGIAFYGWLRIKGAPETSIEENVMIGGLRAIVENNVFMSNISGVNDYSRTRSSSGAAISCAHEARPVIRNNVIVKNEAKGRSDAGGIYTEYYSYPLIEGNWILGNICDDDGGGIYTMKLGNPVIKGNIIAGNWTQGGGVGGIRISKEGRATITGNQILYNPGGGVRSVDSYMNLQDNIILYNPGSSGVGYSSNYSYMMPSIINNNIIRDNEKGAISLDKNMGESPIIEKNNIDDDWGSQKDNYNRVPLFTDKGIVGNALSIEFDSKSYLTILMPENNSILNKKVVGKVIRIGNDWGVVQNQNEESLTLWGLVQSIGSKMVDFELLPSYSE